MKIKKSAWIHARVHEDIKIKSREMSKRYGISLSEFIEESLNCCVTHPSLFEMHTQYKAVVEKKDLTSETKNSTIANSKRSRNES